MKAYTIDTEFDASDKYIVDNIIARKSITLIVASPKKGKTALGLNLGICINNAENRRLISTFTTRFITKQTSRLIGAFS